MSEAKKVTAVAGVCRYCGQTATVPPCETQEEADVIATAECACRDAMHARRERQLIEHAVDRINQLFGACAKDYGFAPVSDDCIGLLDDVAAQIAAGAIESAAVKVSKRCTATLALTTSGSIRVTRRESRATNLEAV